MPAVTKPIQLLLALLCAALFACTAWAQSAADPAQRRVALVIGNNAYESSPLANSVNDAQAMASALREAGFAVTLLTDVDQRQFQLALREFGERLKASGGGGTGLFYYAGHGVQIRGRNFLIPVRSNIVNEDEVAYAAVDAQAVLDKMESAGNGTNIVILDACRNNPFTRSTRSAQQGLAQMDAPVGTLVAYATAPGSVAVDSRPGMRNGLYTTHLLDAVRNRGLKVEDVFKQVRSAVLRASGNKQMPWEASALVGDFYFHPPREGAAPATMAQTPAAPVAPAFDSQGAIDDALWEAVKDSRSSAEIFAYLNRFPAGRHARLARQRLLDLAQPGLPALAAIGGRAPPPTLADPSEAMAVRESSERLRGGLVASRSVSQELAAWADVGSNVRPAKPARNAAGFSEGDRWRYLATDLLGWMTFRGYIWRVDRIDADGGLWLNGGRQRLDAQGQRRSGNEEVTGVWLDYEPPLPIVQIAQGGAGQRGELATVVQERGADGAVLRHTFKGSWQTRADPVKGPRGIEGLLTTVLVEIKLEGHTNHADGRRVPAQWIHRYWMAQSALLPLAIEIEETESGLMRRRSLHELVAADILALDASPPGAQK